LNYIVVAAIDFAGGGNPGSRSLLVWLMVSNATFNNILVTSWWSVLLVEETGENHQPAESHWQTLSHNVELTTLVVVCTDCIDSCKSNYHAMTALGSRQVGNRCICRCGQYYYVPYDSGTTGPWI
jgi:hypothetical protein